MEFDVGSFYLIKSDKLLIFIQVLERSYDYIVVQVKGTELQERTLCHDEESTKVISYGG
jgi:hypothetical protein